MGYSKALITGSHSGLGKALADHLESLNIPVLRTGSSIHNLTNPPELEALKALIREEKPDLLINNAGIGYYGPTLTHTLDVLDVNIRALTELTLTAADTLIKDQRPGTILNISSAAAFFPYPTFNLYAASKAYVNHFSLALDNELRPHNVRILCACPGQIATPFRTRASKGHPQKPDRRTLSLEAAIHHLMWQIKKKKPLYIFDWRTRFMVHIARLIPRKILNPILKRALQDRYQAP